jgi:ribosomal protein S4
MEKSSISLHTKSSIGDVITIKERLKESALYKTLVEEFQRVRKKEFWSKHLTQAFVGSTVDPKKLSITITAIPEASDFDKMIDVQRIVEFYSK